jgi:peroxiredoxin
MIRMAKRVFVEATGVIGLGLMAVAVVSVATGGPWWWLGVVVSWVSLLSYFGLMLVRPPSTRARHLWPVYAGALAGTGIAAPAGPGAAVLAGLAFALALVYAYWYSRQHTPITTLAVGSPLPEFSLTTIDQTVVSSEVLTHQPQVILFYRGNWCPFCMAQVREIAGQYRELHDRGVGVALISPQTATDTAELATRFDVPMQFYVDTDGAAAAMLDITQAGGVPVLYGAGTTGDTVVPTVIITDSIGTVIWFEHADNHRIRPEPGTFLEVLDREGITHAR